MRVIALFVVLGLLGIGYAQYQQAQFQGGQQRGGGYQQGGFQSGGGSQRFVLIWFSMFFTFF